MTEGRQMIRQDKIRRKKDGWYVVDDREQEVEGPYEFRRQARNFVVRCKGAPNLPAQDVPIFFNSVSEGQKPIKPKTKSKKVKKNKR